MTGVAGRGKAGSGPGIEQVGEKAVRNFVFFLGVIHRPAVDGDESLGNRVFIPRNVADVACGVPKAGCRGNQIQHQIDSGPLIFAQREQTRLFHNRHRVTADVAAAVIACRLVHLLSCQIGKLKFSVGVLSQGYIRNHRTGAPGQGHHQGGCAQYAVHCAMVDHVGLGVGEYNADHARFGNPPAVGAAPEPVVGIAQ